MPWNPILKLDQVFEQEWMSDFAGMRLLRSFTIEDVPTDDPEQALTVIENVQGMPTRGTPSKKNSLCIVVGYRVRGWTDRNVRGVIVYETPAGAGAEHVLDYWYAAKTKQITQIMTQRDGSGAAIMVGYSGGGSFTGVFDQAFRAAGGLAYPATMQKYVSIDVLTLTSYRTNPFHVSPSGLNSDVIINNTTFMGKVPGYWLCLGVENTTESHGKLYRSVATFWGRFGGWDGIEFFVDPATKVLGALISAQDAQQIMASRIIPGNAWQLKRNGIVRAQLYDDADFGTIFQNIDATNI